MAETLAQLEAEYCPPIDPALLSAILSDYDLSCREEIEQARNTLDSLKEDALLEEAAGFDASGMGGLQEGLDSGGRAESYDGTSTSHSKGTDITSISNPLSSLDLEDTSAGPDTPIGEAEDLEKLHEDTKMQLLEEVFGKHVSRYTIEYTLRKCNGNWHAAMEELLNHAYFAEAANGVDGVSFSVKGVEGFAEDNIIPRGRKGKAKNKRFRNLDERRSSSLPGLHDKKPTHATNKWKSAAEDVEFIASRTGIANATVSSVYYTSGASLPETIAVLLKASTEESKYVVTDGVAVSSQARELGGEFPTIPLEDLTVIIRLTRPSITTARELATALSATSKEQNEGVTIIPRYTRPDEIDTDPSWSRSTKKAKSATSSRSPSSNGLSAAARRDAYDLARTAALSQANAARRKAKSDHLMSGAAAYYGQVGREYAELSSNASSQAADQFAASQSTATHLDLHGIDVRNAVRIAQEKVEEWWDGLGENRVNGRIGAEERRTGYRIVVGLGRHSEGGNSKLGPAVAKMLRQEGWRVEPAGGVILVKGPSKK